MSWKVILEAAAEAGAERAGMTIVRLPYEIKTLFEEWLRGHFPDRADKVLSLIRQCRDGKLNHAEFGKRMTGTGPYAQLLQQRFEKAVKRYGLDKERKPHEPAAVQGADQADGFVLILQVGSRATRGLRWHRCLFKAGWRQSDSVHLFARLFHKKQDIS